MQFGCVDVSFDCETHSNASCTIDCQGNSCDLVRDCAYQGTTCPTVWK